MGFNTELLHGTKTGDPVTGATLTPVYQSSAFFQPSAEQHEKLFHNKAAGYSYTRINNPTIAAFEERMTVLEKGVASVACASGMAAITNALLNIVGSGDEIITSTSLYGGTIDLYHDLEAFGITTIFADTNDLEDLESKITDKTRVIFAETIGNPKLDVTDIPALAGIAKRHNLPLMIDNTVATAFLVRPLELGADIVINSTSKYINGNSSAISGVITDAGRFKWDLERYPGMKDYKKFAKFAFTAKLRNGLFRNMGACMAPQTAYYNLLGMETLGLRMERACDNAMQLAAYIEENYKDITVNYAGLETSNWHEIAKSQFDGHYGGIFTLRLGSKERAYAFINALKYPLKVSNIGDTKTLVIHPESTISVHSTEEEKKAGGVFDDLVRVSVGIEDIDDLIWDFKQAIESLS